MVGQMGGRLIVLSRAVDNQVFFGMCSPARDLSAGYHAVRQNLLSLSTLHKINHRGSDSVGSFTRGGPNVRVLVFKSLLYLLISFFQGGRAR